MQSRSNFSDASQAGRFAICFPARRRWLVCVESCGVGVGLLEWFAMRLFTSALVLFTVGFLEVRVFAQAAPVAAATEGQAATAAPMTRPSEVLQMPLQQLQDALSGVRLEKWKMSGELRDAADGDIRSIEQDFRQTLPPLLATADSEPGSVAKVLPAIRNVDALYDVAVRVSAMGRLTAPAAQSAALDRALKELAEARRRVGDQLQTAAVAEESRVSQLQASLRASQAAAAAAQQSAAAAAQPVTKPVVKPKKKVRPKPASPAAAPVTQP